MCWAGIESRQTAALVLGGSLVVFGVIGALSPIPSPAPAADVAAASKSAAVGGPSEATVANAAVSPSPTPAASSPRPVPAPRPVGLVTVAGVALPNRSLTPGSVFATATTARICVTGYSSSVRAVNDSLHAAVFARYGIPYPAPTGAYEVDHLIALELGGDNSIANLWPEPQSHGAGYPRKDQLENHLHGLVCAGQLPLRTAQLAIAENWVAAARYTSGTARSRVIPAARSATTPPAPAGVYYANCTAARAAGVTPLLIGHPGYRSGLDRDGDGIACE